MKRNGIVHAYRLVTVGVLLVGLGLDLAGILWGVGPVALTLFTPPVEAFLTLWFLSAFVLGVAAFRHLDLPTLPARIFQVVITAYMLALALMHGVNNLLLDNIDRYVALFGGGFYPYAALVVLLAMTIFTATRRAK